MPAEDREPFSWKLQQRVLELLLTGLTGVFPARRWSDYCGQGNSVLSLPRPETHLTFRAESHGLRVGWYQKKMRCFYQKTDKGYWASRRSFPLYQRNGQSGGLWRRQAGRKRMCAGWWGYKVSVRVSWRVVEQFPKVCFTDCQVKPVLTGGFVTRVPWRRKSGKCQFLYYEIFLTFNILFYVVILRTEVRICDSQAYWTMAPLFNGAFCGISICGPHFGKHGRRGWWWGWGVAEETFWNVHRGTVACRWLWALRNRPLLKHGGIREGGEGGDVEECRNWQSGLLSRVAGLVWGARIGGRTRSQVGQDWSWGETPPSLRMLEALLSSLFRSSILIRTWSLSWIWENWLLKKSVGKSFNRLWVKLNLEDFGARRAWGVDGTMFGKLATELSSRKDWVLPSHSRDSGGTDFLHLSFLSLCLLIFVCYFMLWFWHSHGLY